MYLPAHHPIAKELQALDYKQMRDEFQEEHRVKFRYVLPYIRILLHIWQIAFPQKIYVFRSAMDEISILHDLICCNWPVKLCLYLLQLKTCFKNWMKRFKSRNMNNALYFMSASIFKTYRFVTGNVLLFSYKDQFLLQLIGFHFDCLDNYQYAFIVDVLIC